MPQTLEDLNAIESLNAANVSQDKIQSLLGHLTHPLDPTYMEATAPWNGELITRLPVADADAVELAFHVSRRAQELWSMTSLKKRCEVILRFHDLVLERRDEILDIIQLETGKARIHALEEVLDVAMTSRYYARIAGAALKPRKGSGAFPVLTRAVEYHHPVGVVGVISPWNYPLTLGISDIIPMLIAGNGAVTKPDSQTTLSALWAIDLLAEAGVPEGLIGAVAGEGAVLGPEITSRADYVMFTGSTGVGRLVAAQCGERLIGCSMELGGKNAMIVCEDADIERAVEIAERACWSNAGQLCISMERIYVHESIRDQFVDAFVDRILRLEFRNDFSWGQGIGSLISQRQLDTVKRHVDDAVAKGATVLAGGSPRPDKGPFFFEPTLLEGVTPDMECCVNETFGPVVSVYTFVSEEEAIRLANDSDYGLNAAVITRNTKRGNQIGQQLHAGTVNVNEAYAAGWGSLDFPMGGFKQSGLGRRHGSGGLLKYTEAQTVATQRLQGFGKPEKGPIHFTDEQWADALTLGMKVLKSLGLK